MKNISPQFPGEQMSLTQSTLSPLLKLQSMLLINAVMTNISSKQINSTLKVSLKIITPVT